ncbi:MAG: alpha/beta fold hydrolase [Verrucomicrobia bacterium]|nr:alpha/beta fold hydrolase [Verrucomicrobiota bacterium]
MFSLRHFIPRLACALIALVLAAGCANLSRKPASGPWNLAALSKVPAATWGSTNGLVQELYYEGELLNGKPTRVFAYLGRPTNSAATKNPAMVLVHGGGGKAFKEWAEHWAKRGYVALAMDLAGHGPSGRSPDGGPDQADTIKFRNFTEAEASQMWTYHAVAAVVRGHSLLRSLPEVDANRTGITGISWGGYLTCIAAGIDARFKVAVPVYGCGFLGDNSVWKDKSLAAMTPEARALWLRLFDPSQYVGDVRYPILFVNGTTDFAYPMDSYRKTYRLVPEKWRHVSMAVNRPHGHIWTFPEVDAFVGNVLRGESPLPRIGVVEVKSGQLRAAVDRATGFKEVSLCYTTNSGAWQKRSWQAVPARIENGKLVGELPPTRPLVAFLAVKDAAGCHISSEHVELSTP